MNLNLRIIEFIPIILNDLLLKNNQYIIIFVMTTFDLFAISLYSMTVGNSSRIFGVISIIQGGPIMTTSMFI